MIASFALSLEAPTQLLNYSVTRWRFKLAADYWDSYPDRVSAVTALQVQAAARSYLDPQRMQIVAVGDLTRVADVLKKLGAVEAFDADGKTDFVVVMTGGRVARGARSRSGVPGNRRSKFVHTSLQTPSDSAEVFAASAWRDFGRVGLVHRSVALLHRTKTPA